MKSKYLLLVFIIVLAFSITSCKTSKVTEVANPQVDETTVTVTEVETKIEATVTPTVEKQETATDDGQGETVEASPTPLPPYPLSVTFTADDGTELYGHFWAPAGNNVPVIVLMHQYPLDHNTEWIAIAPWLQNRGLVAAVRTGGEPFTDPRWFPPMFEGFENAVFSFSFRNCLGGCREDSVESREEWIIDAVSAIKAAASFKSVDPQKVIVIGTSIGADAAVDACERLLDDDSVNCIGVVAISPASWLEVDYTETVTTLNEAGVEVRCLASENDGITADTCRSFEGEHYLSVIDPGDSHGVRMFNPANEVDVPVLLVQWLIDWTLLR